MIKSTHTPLTLPSVATLAFDDLSSVIYRRSFHVKTYIQVAVHYFDPTANLGIAASPYSKTRIWSKSPSKLTKFAALPWLEFPISNTCWLMNILRILNLHNWSRRFSHSVLEYFLAIIMAQYSDSSPKSITIAVILGLASILAVFLRILARRRSKVHLGMDDVFAVIALCGFLAFLGLIIWSWFPESMLTLTNSLCSVL